MKSYDVIVLGAGGIGSAALWQVAKRGARVLGIDRFDPPHDRGSSHGHTRVIRQAYFEHADYVPLVLESYRGWRELEEVSGKRLFHQVGLIEIGPKDGIVVPGVLQAAVTHGLSVNPMTPQEIAREWPGFTFPDNFGGVFESSAGYLLVEDCVRAHLEAAREAGAEVLPNTEVVSWMADSREVRVRTANDEFVAERLIIAAGAWAGKLLADLRVPLIVRRKSLFWFATEAPDYDVASGCPIYLFELPDGVFYGFPKLDDRGVKFAEHSGGRAVEDPLAVDRAIDQWEQQRLADVLRAYLPGVSERVTDHATCMYTMSPDENFIVDRHPQHEHVVFAAGLSGHGFKFAPALGTVLAQLALDGSTKLPVEFLSIGRF